MSNCETVRLTPGLGQFGRKVYSQNDEDGIIERILADLQISSGHFVEFGVGAPWDRKLSETGLEANCRLLQEQGWQGLFMDAAEYAPEFGVVRETITPFNINGIMQKHGVPPEFDVLSVDIDGQDFWVWMNLQARPRLVVIEYNSSLEPNHSCVIPLLPDFAWDGTDWFGASLAALNRLAESKFYKLVYANGVNAFFVRSDLFSNHGDFSLEQFCVRTIIHPHDPKHREYITI